ncbi:MAG: transcription antitermination factor NusB [Gammaproteobacteria bacterium]
MASHAEIRARILARRCALQALYQWQMAGHDPKDILSEFVAERELLGVDMAYFRELTQEIPKHIHILQSHLRTVIDRPLEQLGTVERAALYIGAYELSFRTEVPWRVVVNEAVELTKMFGAQEAYKYINGALDNLARGVRTDENRKCGPASPAKLA